MRYEYCFSWKLENYVRFNPFQAKMSENSRFLKFSGVIEMERWLEMD